MSFFPLVQCKACKLLCFKASRVFWSSRRFWASRFQPPRTGALFERPQRFIEAHTRPAYKRRERGDGQITVSDVNDMAYQSSAGKWFISHSISSQMERDLQLVRTREKKKNWLRRKKERRRRWERNKGKTKEWKKGNLASDTVFFVNAEKKTARMINNWSKILVYLSGVYGVRMAFHDITVFSYFLRVTRMSRWEGWRENSYISPCTLHIRPP